MITKQGVVTKISGDKTVKVEVHSYEAHAKYHKRFRKTAKFLAHDEAGTVKVGDEVTIGECKPMSKRKNWKIVTPSAK